MISSSVNTTGAVMSKTHAHFFLHLFEIKYKSIIFQQFLFSLSMSNKNHRKFGDLQTNSIVQYYYDTEKKKWRGHV